MNSKQYLIKLTPHHRFFFGGEGSFGGTDGEQANYLVKSNYFPQQTGILGLIRHQLLIQNDLLKTGKISDKIKAKVLIGEKSFRMGQDNLTFGVIKNISPVMIAKDDQFYFPVNKEYQLDKKTENPVLREFQVKEGLPYLNKFNPKSPLADWFVNQSVTDFKPYHKNETITSNGPFMANQQVGIRKNYAGVTEEKAYYLQTFLTLDTNYSFAFTLALDEYYSFKNELEQVLFHSSDLVVFGGEQSTFKMEVMPLEESFDQLTPNYPASDQYYKIVLLSDTKLASNEIFDHLEFAITETKDFRFLETSVDHTNNYAGLSTISSNGKLTKSKRFKLLAKGSVLYFKKSEKDFITKELDNPLFQMIGYNRYKIIKPILDARY